MLGFANMRSSPQSNKVEMTGNFKRPTFLRFNFLLSKNNFENVITLIIMNIFTCRYAFLELLILHCMDCKFVIIIFFITFVAHRVYNLEGNKVVWINVPFLQTVAIYNFEYAALCLLLFTFIMKLENCGLFLTPEEWCSLSCPFVATLNTTF